MLIDASGQPKVTDFGLAKQTETDNQLTRSGQIPGTPSDMPPEQASGNTRQVGPQADIYSLGASPSFLLTGRPPFQAASVMDTLMQVIEQEAPAVRQLNPSVSADLDGICAKCLMKEPSRRYATADELAADLHRFLAGEPVQARGHSVSGRVASALQRSQYDVQFGGYGNLLYGIAAVVLANQVAVTRCQWTTQPLWMLPLLYMTQVLLIGLLFRRFRPGGMLPRNPAERQMWSVWSGFIVTCGVLGTTNHLIGRGVVTEEHRLFPAISAVSGLAFCFLGSSYWGRCYLLAAMFFGLSFVMTATLPWAGLEFWAAWAAVLIIIVRRLNQLAAEQTLRSQAASKPGRISSPENK